MNQENNNNLISCDKVGLIRGHRVLLKELSFDLNKGQAIHLKGKNGSGKTSLLKLLNTSLKPTQGEIKLFDHVINNLTDNDFKKIIYLGHQTAIKPSLTVLENLKFNTQIFDCTNPNKDNLNYAIEQVGLGKFKNQLASQLSAGQKRRVMLARLWIEQVLSKPIWLLDEPLTALDVEAISRLEDHISNHLNGGGGVIFTSHQKLSLRNPITTLTLGEAL